MRNGTSLVKNYYYSLSPEQKKEILDETVSTVQLGKDNAPLFLDVAAPASIFAAYHFMDRPLGDYYLEDPNLKKIIDYVGRPNHKNAPVAVRLGAIQQYLDEINRFNEAIAKNPKLLEDKLGKQLAPKIQQLAELRNELAKKHPGIFKWKGVPIDQYLHRGYQFYRSRNLLGVLGVLGGGYIGTRQEDKRYIPALALTGGAIGYIAPQTVAGWRRYRAQEYLKGIKSADRATDILKKFESVIPINKLSDRVIKLRIK